MKQTTGNLQIIRNKYDRPIMFFNLIRQILKQTYSVGPRLNRRMCMSMYLITPADINARFIAFLASVLFSGVPNQV